MGGAGITDFFYYESKFKLKKKILFYKESISEKKSKSKIFFLGRVGSGGGGDGRGGGVGLE